MTPVLVTPPTVPVLTLSEAKAHLRVDIDAEDALIEGLVAAATAHLDGWRGVLGRAIMPQTWAVTVPEPAIVVLPMPDVALASLDGENLSIVVGPAGCVIHAGHPGVVQFTCGLPAEQLPAAKAAAKLFLSHLYDQTDLSPAYGALVEALRWRGV